MLSTYFLSHLRLAPPHHVSQCFIDNRCVFIFLYANAKIPLLRLGLPLFLPQNLVTDLIIDQVADQFAEAVSAYIQSIH